MKTSKANERTNAHVKTISVVFIGRLRSPKNWTNLTDI